MFQGSIVALVTPMYADGAIDYVALERLIAWHLEVGTDGLVLLGTTGESATLTASERQEVIRRGVDQVKGQIPLIVGTGSQSTQQTIEWTQEAMQLGADAALVVTPYYNKPTQEGLYLHYSAVAQAVPMPLILYNVPSRTGCDLLPETVYRLSKIANIVALKDATGQLSRLTAAEVAGCHLDFLSGDDASALPFLLSGGKGVVTVVGNVVPRLFREMCWAALSFEREKAWALEGKLSLLHQALFCESNPIPTKWLLHQMGLIDSGIRLPLTPLSLEYHEKVRLALSKTQE